MIFFIALKGDSAFVGIRKPCPVRLEGLQSENLRFVAWMEVYPTLTDLFAAIVNAALEDTVCIELLDTLSQDLGIAPLDRTFLTVGKNLSRTAQLFYKVIYYWAHPLIGNTQTPSMPSQLPGGRIKSFQSSMGLSTDTASAMSMYVQETKKHPKPTVTRKAQIRAFHNITDAARAVLGEVADLVISRVDKLFALLLCSSEKLLFQQRSILHAYAKNLNYNDDIFHWMKSEYGKYYFGLKRVEKVDKERLGPALLQVLIAECLGDEGVGHDSATVNECLNIFRRLPPTVRCTILFNDLRKFSGIKADEENAKPVLTLKPCFDEQGHNQPSSKQPPRKIWPAIYQVDNPKEAAPVYPKQCPTYLRAWNPDEHAQYAITYRINLCPLWAGPSGHVAKALRFWKRVLVDYDDPSSVPMVVAASLYMFWRLYYDKRISAAHTITETFEATLVLALNANQGGFELGAAPDIKTPLPPSADGYDLLTVARVTSGPALGAIHPIGLVRTLARCLSSSAGFAGYDELRRRIDEERAKLARRYVVQQWSHDASDHQGVDVKSFAPTKHDDEDNTNDSLVIAKAADVVCGSVLQGLARERVHQRAPAWEGHMQVMREIRRRVPLVDP